jgi:hypothetical protein
MCDIRSPDSEDRNSTGSDKESKRDILRQRIYRRTNCLERHLHTKEQQTMEMTREQDREIGQDFLRQLHRITERMTKRYGIDRITAADFLIAGALFTAAGIYELTVSETMEVVKEIAESVQNDELPEATRH